MLGFAGGLNGAKPLAPCTPSAHVLRMKVEFSCKKKIGFPCKAHNLACKATPEGFQGATGKPPWNKHES